MLRCWQSCCSAKRLWLRAVGPKWPSAQRKENTLGSSQPLQQSQTCSAVALNSVQPFVHQLPLHGEGSSCGLLLWGCALLAAFLCSRTAEDLGGGAAGPLMGDPCAGIWVALSPVFSAAALCCAGTCPAGPLLAPTPSPTLSSSSGGNPYWFGGSCWHWENLIWEEEGEM